MCSYLSNKTCGASVRSKCRQNRAKISDLRRNHEETVFQQKHEFYQRMTTVTAEELPALASTNPTMQISRSGPTPSP